MYCEDADGRWVIHASPPGIGTPTHKEVGLKGQSKGREGVSERVSDELRERGSGGGGV